MVDVTNTMIQSLTEQIDRLTAERDKLMGECEHKRVTYKTSSITGDIFNQDRYYNTVTCIECGKRMTFDSHEELSNYHLHGVIGSEFNCTEEEYETYKKIEGKL